MHQKDVIKNITTFFDLQGKFFDFYRDYSFLPSEVKYKTKYGEGFKILTPKQMLQRLPIALAKVKDFSEIFFSKIIQKFY